MAVYPLKMDIIKIWLVPNFEKQNHQFMVILPITAYGGITSARLYFSHRDQKYSKSLKQNTSHKYESLYTP